MSRQISVTEVTGMPEGEYEVVISDDKSSTEHTVRLKQEYIEQLGWDSARANDLIEKSFNFLLEREGKESILREFELPVIARYFPEFEEVIRDEHPE